VPRNDANVGIGTLGLHASTLTAGASTGSKTTR
jgi:hypothetical protein